MAGTKKRLASEGSSVRTGLSKNCSINCSARRAGQPNYWRNKVATKPQFWSACKGSWPEAPLHSANRHPCTSPSARHLAVSVVNVIFIPLIAAGDVKVISQLRAQLIPAPNLLLLQRSSIQLMQRLCRSVRSHKQQLWPRRSHVDFKVDGAGTGVVCGVHLASRAAQAEVGWLAVAEGV
jgi:hypothetical protein